MMRIIQKTPPPVYPDEEVALERVEFFRALGPQLLARVRAHVREQLFAAHASLFVEGQSAEALWAVRHGVVRLYKTSPDGRVTTLETLAPGEIFGAVSALDADRYPASAESLAEVSVWTLARSTFVRLLAEEPRLGVEILGIVSRRLHAAHERLRSLAHDPAPARLARELLHAASNGEARITRRALAEAAGTTVETAIRVLRRFHREGIIRGAVRHVSVIDAPALRRIAGDLDL
jgi:CRP/FNR family transcriptional regulator